MAVIRLRSLGDCVLTTPALALLHEFRPDLKISIVVEDRFAGVFKGNPAVERIVTPDLWAARRARPDLCLNLHGGSRSMWMTAVSGAKVRAGFGHHAGSWIYNTRIPKAQEILGEERVVHTAEHLASAVFYLGVPRTEIPRAKLYTKPESLGSRYAVFHPFASAVEKAWPAEKFCAVARQVSAELGLRPVFIGTAADDLGPFTAEFETRQGRSLDETKSLLAGASFFVGNDSGPAHMAAAFGLPVVVLFGSSDPVVWAPWRTAAEKLVATDGSIARIGVNEVVEATRRLYSQRVVPA